MRIPAGNPDLNLWNRLVQHLTQQDQDWTHLNLRPLNLSTSNDFWCLYLDFRQNLLLI